MELHNRIAGHRAGMADFMAVARAAPATGQAALVEVITQTEPLDVWRSAETLGLIIEQNAPGFRNAVEGAADPHQRLASAMRLRQQEEVLTILSGSAEFDLPVRRPVKAVAGALGAADVPGLDGD